MATVEMIVHEWLDDLRQSGTISEGDWESLRESLIKILSYAGIFYDEYDHYHYDWALGIAQHVLEGSPPEDVIYAMAGTAYFLLNDAKKLSAETRARLEAIRANHPDFCRDHEGGVMKWDPEEMLIDEATKAKLVEWTVVAALADRSPRLSNNDVAFRAYKLVTSFWRDTIVKSVIDRLGRDEVIRQNQIDRNCPF